MRKKREIIIQISNGQIVEEAELEPMRTLAALTCRHMGLNPTNLTSLEQRQKYARAWNDHY